MREMQEKEDEGMKEENVFKLSMIAVIILIGLTTALLWRMGDRNQEHHPQQSCWQVGDTLHLVTAKGDTVRFDVSKLEDK